MALTRVRNIDISDREMLFIISDCADENGMTAAIDVVDRLGMATNGQRTKGEVSARGAVSKRLAWMADPYGYLRRVPPENLGLKKSEGPRWVITEKGRVLMGGRLSAALKRELQKGDPGTELLLMRELAVGYVGTDATYAHAIRREWLHNAARRPRGS